ncbi:DUF3892 domain-containing protein [Deltaproteobacteria bacterium TL4]
MNIIAIKQLESGKNVFFITDEYEEYTLEEIITLVKKGKVDNVQTVCTEIGTQYIRSKANQFKSDNLDSIAISCNENDCLLFDLKYLYLKAQNGRIKRKWKATAGNQGSTAQDQYKSDYGPLPEGEYEVRFDKTLDFENSKSLWDKLKWIVKSPSWGFVNTPLYPSKDNEMYGRGDFYIHGGTTPGSNGCIDLADKNEDFHILLRLYHRNFRLIVQY